MEISGLILQKKIRELFPDLSTSITAEVLNKICDQSTNRPFLKWFCSHVTRDNILSEEDIQIKQHLIKTGKWFTDDLTNLVEKATENCPQLRQLLVPEIAAALDNDSRYEAKKEAFEEDLEYLRVLEESTKTLKEEEERLNEEIEHEQTELEKDGIDVEERYKDCLDLCRDFDNVHKLFHSEVERLINVYADAAEMKGPPIVWTQMPLELCKNQTEMYINYLAAYIKRQFGNNNNNNNNNNKDENICDSDYNTFMEDSRDRRGEEMLQELSNCLRNLTTSRVEEITSRVSADACTAIEELAKTIYNNGNPRLPQSQSQLELEIAELSGRRDFFEENVRLLRENRLEEAVTHSAELAITEIVLLDARLRYERRERRLSSMFRLRESARERGHAHSDLLCMLMELQYRRITEAVEFVADARYFLSTEYSLSSVRDNVMQQLQTEYEATASAPPSDRNAYNKIFISMMNGSVNDADSLTTSMKRLEQLLVDNEADEKKIFGPNIDAKINEVNSFEDRLNEVYNREIDSGRTTSLIPMPVEVATRMNETFSRISQFQNEVLTRRNQLKEKLRKNIDEFDWETKILWQRFLVDPDSLKKVYDDAEKRLEQLYFGTS